MVAMVAMVLAAAAAGAASAADERWQVRLAGVSAQTDALGQADSSQGWGLGLEYRFSPRFGVELGGLTTEPEGAAEVELFAGTRLIFESSFRMTPVLARLNVHLLPGRRVDLYVAPVAGYVRMSDVTLRIRAEGTGDARAEEAVFEERIGTEDELAWGAALGVDIPVGHGGSALTLGATYLRLPLTVSGPDGSEQGGDIDPLLLHVGYGFRF
jgi:outer membrane protein W